MNIKTILSLSMILSASLKTEAQFRSPMINPPTQALVSKKQECPIPMAKEIHQKKSEAHKQDLDFQHLIENIFSKKTSKLTLYFKNKNQANKKVQDLLKSMKQYISKLPGCIGCNEKSFNDISNKFKKNLELLISEGHKISQLTVIGEHMQQVSTLFYSRKIFGTLSKAGETKHVDLPDRSNCFILKITLLDKQGKNKEINIGFSQSFSIFYFQSK